MYILLILFLASLSGIIIMIWRKLALLQNGQILEHSAVSFEIPHLEKLRDVTVKNIKKYGHKGLVETLRFHLRTSKFLKNKYDETKIKIRNINLKDQSSQNGNLPDRQVSKFLKMIGDYKRKIRAIKHKIKEEENL